VLARLPFEPFAIVRGISHRGLPGDDVSAARLQPAASSCSYQPAANHQPTASYQPRAAMLASCRHCVVSTVCSRHMSIALPKAERFHSILCHQLIPSRVRSADLFAIVAPQFRECGVIFVYVLCCMSIKPSLQRALGHTPLKPTLPKTVFGIPTDLKQS
jgi:hypothetical protein